jgi:hypothetical protein
MTFDPATHVHTVKEIDLMRSCPRKHAAKYLHRLDDPKHANAQDGIDMHHILEAMLAQGPASNTAPESKIGEWARALYPLTPAGARGELTQTFDLFGRRASFRIDWTAKAFDGFGDWKSTSDPKWALAGPAATGEQQLTALSGDLQANLEAYGFCKVFRKSFVDLLWCYVEKSTCRTWTVAGRLYMQYCEEWLRANALPHIEMIELLRSVEPTPAVQAVPHNIIACRGQGAQCSFLGACQFLDAPVTTEQLYQLARPAPQSGGQ